MLPFLGRKRFGASLKRCLCIDLIPRLALPNLYTPKSKSKDRLDAFLIYIYIYIKRKLTTYLVEVIFNVVYKRKPRVFVGKVVFNLG